MAPGNLPTSTYAWTWRVRRAMPSDESPTSSGDASICCTLPAVRTMVPTSSMEDVPAEARSNAARCTVAALTVLHREVRGGPLPAVPHRSSQGRPPTIPLRRYSTSCCNACPATGQNLAEFRKRIATAGAIAPAIPGQQHAPHEGTVVTDRHAPAMHAICLPVALKVGQLPPGELKMEII